MSDLIALASLKLQLAAAERIRSLPTKIESIKTEQAAKGSARSGATLKAVRSLCIAHVREHGISVEAEYKWVVNQALVASQTWSERLAAKAPEEFESLLSVAAKHLTDASVFVGKPEVAERLIADVQVEAEAAMERVKLAVRTAFAEKSRGLVRSLPGAVTGAISKALRGGS